MYLKSDLRLESLKSSIKNHFVGSLGEFFFCFMLNDRKEFLLPYNIGDNTKTAFNFSNVTPRLENEDDFGVDLVGDIEYIDKKNPCAIQVKFWNPVSKKLTSDGLTRLMFTNEMASGVYTDAVLNGYIDNDSKKSVIVCWTLNKNRVSKWLKRNVMLSSKMSFLDLPVLKNKVDKKSPEFWAQVKNKFNEIKTY